MSPDDDEPLDKKALVRFMPEGAIAGLAVVLAPVWAIVLFTRGRVLAGIIVWVASWSFGYLAYASWRKGDLGGVFVAIGGIICLVLAILRWTR